jgi:L-ribulokinase
MHTMGQGFDMEYKPNQKVVQVYERRYQKYMALGKLLEKHGD